MLKKLPSVLLLCAVSLWAANFWDTKPYTEWTDKEVDNMLKNSPWGDRMGVRTGEQGVVAKDDAKGPIMGEVEAQVTMVWQTALPIRQAMAKLQFKGEAATSPQAKALIERQSEVYVLHIAGLPGSARPAAGNKEKLTADTVIKIKNKPDLKPSDIEMPAAGPGGGKGGPPPGQAAPVGDAGGLDLSQPSAPAKGGKGGPSLPAGPGFGGGGFGGTFDLYYVFPKSAGISEKDGEMEFISKMGKVTVRKKFKLKDMVFNGKFEM